MEISQQASISARLNNAKESPLFYKVFSLVSIGITIDAADIYMASSANTTMVQSDFATEAQGSMFLSPGFLGLFLSPVTLAIALAGKQPTN